jgi:hypothetical protein
MNLLRRIFLVKKALLLSLLVGLLACSSSALATPVSFYYQEYTVHAYAENTATGACEENTETSTSKIGVSASRVNALATASAKTNDYYLYADANVEQKNRFAESWVSADRRFQADCTDVLLQFDYGIAASTVGKASAAAVLYVRIFDFVNNPVGIFYLAVNASSEGTQLSSSDEASYFGTFDETIDSLVVGEVYALNFEIWEVYAEALSGVAPEALAYGWIDNVRVKCLDDPSFSPVPVPGTWFLLISGLVGVLPWGWRKRS